MLQKKDETMGDTHFKDEYKVSVEGAQAVQQFIVADFNNALNKVTVEDDHAKDLGVSNRTRVNKMAFIRGQMYLDNRFQFESYVVERVTIRWVTTAEAWSAIGGLYAACMMVMSLMFKDNGKKIRNEKVETVMTFRWVPKSWRLAWLAELDTQELQTVENCTDSTVAALRQELEASRRLAARDAIEATEKLKRMQSKYDALEAAVYALSLKVDSAPKT